jgi:outer membrane lipoprotein
MIASARGVCAGAAVLLALAASGCASSRVPQPIRDHELPSPSVAEVQARPPEFMGTTVRWGGRILEVHNGPSTTHIEVLAKPLRRSGEPEGSASGTGRFLLELAGFKDPADFPKDRALSVVGPLVRITTQDVGEYPYPYPVVSAGTWYLWPERPKTTVVPVPIGYPWYGPWYSPWYGPWYGPWY